jgi:hypothetical protein
MTRYKYTEGPMVLGKLRRTFDAGHSLSSPHKDRSVLDPLSVAQDVTDAPQHRVVVISFQLHETTCGVMVKRFQESCSDLDSMNGH